MDQFNTLTEHLEGCRAKFFGYEGLLKRRSETSKWQSVFERISPTVFQSLVNLLREVPGLAIFDTHFMHHGRMGGPLSYEDLAHWLIRRSMSKDVSVALADLQGFLNNDQYDAKQIAIVGGVRVETKKELTDGTTVIPFKGLPGDVHKFVFGDHISHMYRQDSNKLPLVTITKGYAHPKILYEFDLKSVDVALAKPNLKHLDEESDRLRGIKDVQLLMTLIGPSSPALYGSWTAPSASVPYPNSGYAMTYYSPEKTHSPVKEFSELDLVELERIHQIFVNLQESRRRQLRICLWRLNRAIRTHPSSDSAIDLGISMESLFLDEGNISGELTYKLSLRAAKVLKAGYKERSNVKKKFKQLYSIRSKAVHEGRIGRTVSNKDKTPTKELLLEGYSLVRDAIIWSIENPGIDWSSVELG